MDTILEKGEEAKNISNAFGLSNWNLRWGRMWEDPVGDGGEQEPDLEKFGIPANNPNGDAR